MADCTQNKKKDNDPDLAELQTRLYTTHSFVNLCDTRQSSKLLVDWYRDHQKDNKSLEICGKFPSSGNTKLHQRLPNSSPNLRRRKKKYRADRERHNGLFYFIGETVQPAINIGEPLQENKQKAQRQNGDTVTSTTTGKVFENYGNAVGFKFKHFADPEEVVSDYINVNIYKKARLGKVDNKKFAAAMIALHNIRKEASAELNDTGLDKSLKVIQARDTFLPNDKLSTNIPKSEKRLPTIKTSERAIATNNFIFEFGALVPSSSQKDSSNAELMGEKNGAWHRLPKPISLLPKLDRTKLKAKNVETSDIFGKRILPDIPRGKYSNHRKKETRQSTGYRKTLGSDADVQVAGIKSNWHLLKQKRNWTHCQGKNRTTSEHANRLYDTLEKMSTEICRINNSHLQLDSEINYRTCESKFKLSKKCTQVNDEKISEETRGTLSLAENKKMMNLKHLREKIQSKRDFGENLSKSSDKNWFSKVRLKNMHNINTESESIIPGNEILKLEASPKSLNQETIKSKSDVEKYLDKYSLRLNREMNDNNCQENIISYTSSETVADMLARLNIYDVGFHIDAKRKETSMNFGTSPEVKEDFKHISIQKTSTRVGTEAELPETLVFVNQEENAGKECARESNDTSESPDFRPSRMKKEDRKLNTVERGSGTNRTDEQGIKKDNAFVKMGLNGLEGQIPKHVSSQILRSDFLKKDLSIRRADYFRNTLNFKNVLNSGSTIMFGIDNARADLSLCDKWLKKKIQRIIAGGNSKSSKDEEKPPKIHKELKIKRDFEKLHQIVDKKFSERKREDKFTEKTTRQSFAKKFLDVQNDIFHNPKLQAILPELIDSVARFSRKQTR